jgi:hypothetical protein
LDGGPSAAERGTEFLVRELVEDRLYWQATCMRCGDPAGWEVFKPDLVNYRPLGMRGLALFMLLRQVR